MFAGVIVTVSTLIAALIKKKRKFFSYIMKFRSGCKVIYEEGLPNI
jgi:hypothetical protein